MSHTAIKVENISKKYDLLHKRRPKSDSLVTTIAGNINSLFSKRNASESHEDFWALRDINFEIKGGDRVGIIGRNGAGKSTLLKILSRIVKPTSGKIEFEGRMASLLEVGTGFHGDLSGRENIYLNGSVLGMTRREIDACFDEIVAFSEVEKFLDTPVKRYSSGMYVRLAFSVAAHLKSDILIVDEVLAVGDAAFQKKSLGKMEEASQQSGKTILFVSHNMGQISALCNKGILLNQGKIESEGNIQGIINQYFKGGDGAQENPAEIIFPVQTEKELSIRKIEMQNGKSEPGKSFAHDDTISISFTVEKRSALQDVVLGVFFSDMYDKRIFSTLLPLVDKFTNGNTAVFRLAIPQSTFVPGTYRLSAALQIPNVQMIDDRPGACSFEVFDNGSDLYRFAGTDVGLVFVKCKWDY